MMEPLLQPEVINQRLFQRYYIINTLYILVPLSFRFLPYYQVKNLYWELITYSVIGIILLFKIRNSSSLEDFFNVLFLYFKIGNTITLALSSQALSGVYFLCLIILFFVLPQPHYYGPSQVAILTKDSLDRFLKDNEYVVLCVDATWSARSINFHPVLASLSLKYTCDKIKFGRIDLDESETYSKLYKIDDSATSLQIPTLILFQNGKEIQRLPDIKSRFRGAKITFWDRTEDSVIKSFNLVGKYEGEMQKLD